MLLTEKYTDVVKPMTLSIFYCSICVTFCGFNMRELSLFAVNMKGTREGWSPIYFVKFLVLLEYVCTAYTGCVYFQMRTIIIIIFNQLFFLFYIYSLRMGRHFLCRSYTFARPTGAPDHDDLGPKSICRWTIFFIEKKRFLWYIILILVWKLNSLNAKATTFGNIFASLVISVIQLLVFFTKIMCCIKFPPCTRIIII